ncbi:MAG: GGDEF domain-containing protein [Spirochaetia bacterium]|nr:GGDEF domain-containing protein [Spirochaetia bacterium]
MKYVDDFMKSPEAIKHYDLLNSLGIFNYLAHSKRRIHDLEELLSDAIEIFNQDSGDSLIEYITSNLVDRFVPSFLQFVLKLHGDDQKPRTICYHNLKRVESPAPIHSLESYNRYFSSYPGTISFSLFEYSVQSKAAAEQLKPLNPEIIIPISGPDELYGMIIVGKKIIDGEYSDEEIIYIDRLLKFASLSFQNVIHYRSSVTDFKTQLYNHSFFQKRLSEELAKVRRHNNSISILLLDIDHFKQLNDLHGHLAGDKVLFHLSRNLEHTLRQEDVIARFGGEEFIILLPESTKEAAFHVAERVRKEIELMEVHYMEKTLKITVSIGVNHINSTRYAAPLKLIEQADKALYYSKENGRNCVTFYKPGLLFKVTHIG